MSEIQGPESEPTPLSEELSGMLVETARQKLLAETLSGGVCTGFGYTDADEDFARATKQLWQRTTGNTDPAQFKTDLRALVDEIEAKGGAEAVIEAHLDNQA